MAIGLLWSLNSLILLFRVVLPTFCHLSISRALGCYEKGGTCRLPQLIVAIYCSPFHHLHWTEFNLRRASQRGTERGHICLLSILFWCFCPNCLFCLLLIFSHNFPLLHNRLRLWPHSPLANNLLVPNYNWISTTNAKCSLQWFLTLKENEFSFIIIGKLKVGTSM